MVDGVLGAHDAAEGVRLIRGFLHGVQVGDGKVSHLTHETHPLVLALKGAVEMVSTHRGRRQETERQDGRRHREGGGREMDASDERHSPSFVGLCLECSSPTPTRVVGPHLPGVGDLFACRERFEGKK